MKKKVAIIIPCYQEENGMELLKIALDKLFDSLRKYEMCVIAVDDGSTDATLNGLLKIKSAAQFSMEIIKLTGNFGSYNALMAGLNYSNADCYVQLHADLQDPPSHIPDLLEHWSRGNKLVIGQRIKREDGTFYLLGAKFYHFLIRKIALPNIPKGGYDLMLFDHQIKEMIVDLNEKHTSIPYLISSFKFPYVTVPIVRGKRIYGKSSYSLGTRIKLIKDSIISFSYFPIGMLSFVATLNVLILIIIAVLNCFKIFELTFIQWLQYSVLSFILIGVAVIGEYLWRAFEVVRKRPSFVVEEIFD